MTKEARKLKVGDTVQFINGKQANVLKVFTERNTLYILFDNGKYYICLKNDEIDVPD